MSEGFCHSDPSLRYCHQVAEPFEWERAPFSPEREPEFTKVVDRAQDFDVAKGWSFPFPVRVDVSGLLGSAVPHVTGLARYKPMVQLVALYAFYRVQQLVQPTATVHLSGREREALSWIAVGKSAADVGEILNISDRTVEWHIRMAMRKLGASNRIQTVVLALRDGLITL